ATLCHPLSLHDALPICNMHEAERHCAGLDNLSLIRAFSADAARAYDGPKIGLWYLDAEHTYAAVLADFDAWVPHFGKGCMVAFEDRKSTRLNSSHVKIS